MEFTTKLFVRAREAVVRHVKGQTMTEYALILAAVAIVVYAAYQTMGQSIGTLANKIDNDLTNAA